VSSSAIELPFAEGSIDVVIGFDVIEHLVGGEAWQLRFLREIRRVLRPDGLVLLTTPNKLCPFEGHTFLIGPQFLPVSLADAYIRWLRPEFFREYRSYGEVRLLMPGRMKAFHELPWCTDCDSYRPGTRLFLRACRAAGLGWAVFYKFQIAAAKTEAAKALMAIKRPVKDEAFFPEPGFGGLLKKGITLMKRRGT
jgi:SAM-dependent methyltransferase